MKAAKATADAFFSKIIRSHGVCEAKDYLFDCSLRLECAHWFSRRYSWTRTVQSNAFCLCGIHHAWFTGHPVEFTIWAIGQRGRDTYDELLIRSRRTDRFDWDAEVIRLAEVGAALR